MTAPMLGPLDAETATALARDLARALSDALRASHAPADRDTDRETAGQDPLTQQATGHAMGVAIAAQALLDPTAPKVRSIAGDARSRRSLDAADSHVDQFVVRSWLVGHRINQATIRAPQMSAADREAWVNNLIEQAVVAHRHAKSGSHLAAGQCTGLLLGAAALMADEPGDHLYGAAVLLEAVRDDLVTAVEVRLRATL